MQQQDSLNSSSKSEDQMMEPQMVDVFPTANMAQINTSIVNSEPAAILEKLKNYEKLDSDQRLNIAKSISVMYQQIPSQQKNTDFLKSLMNEILKDRQNISRALLEHLPDLQIMLENQVIKENNQTGEQKHQQIIKTVLIPVLISFLNFKKLEIKEEAGKQLGNLAKKLSHQERGNYVLKHMIQMAHDDANQQNRIVAMQLFGSMSEMFGQQFCQQYIGLEILSLGEDTCFKVRKQAINQLPIICRLVSKQFFHRLFVFYHGKTKDQINWAIRKACVQIIIDISELCEPSQRELVLTESMLTLLKDSNKWVRVSAYKNLGKFIYSLKGQKINEKLVIEFCKMVDNQVNSIGKDNQIIYSCAYNFPAVLNALGKQKWQNPLWKVYEKLLKSNDKKIKKTLSQSIHEIAKLIGQQLTEKYLFGVVDMFFKDKSDDIKLGTIRNMSQFMGVLSAEKRDSLIGVFVEFQKDQKKWRIRQCIGKQLGTILEIYEPETIFSYVIPILFKFCSDPVSIVREEAAMKVGDFISKFQTAEGQIFLPGLIENIKAFGSSPKYTQRQSFLIMCKKLMYHKQIFLTNFMELMIQMKTDKVVNVKLLLAQTVRQHIYKKGPLAEDEQLISLRDSLRQDQDQDVREVFDV